MSRSPASASFEAFSLSLSPAAGGRNTYNDPAPNWEQKHEALRTARDLRDDAESALLQETLAGLRELSAGLDADRWMYER